jgi:hypothetical protein
MAALTQLFHRLLLPALEVGMWVGLGCCLVGPVGASMACGTARFAVSVAACALQSLWWLLAGVQFTRP